MSHVSLRRRVSVALTVPTLALATLIVPLGAPAGAAEHTDGPSQAGADWLTAQLSDGLLSYPTEFGDYTDYGLSIDTALGLAALGGHEATVGSISDALEAQLENYITGEAFGDAGSTYAGPAGKALVLAQTAGEDGTTYGGENLVERVESVVATTPPITGRIQDVSQYGDYANVLGQSYVVQSLAAAGSARAADATAFLLQQQCSAGFFRLYLTEDKGAVDQSCDGGTAETSAPDTDATAIAVLALQGQAADPVVGAALDRAEAWLLEAQRANGSFGGGPSTEAPNANSTGVAGWALGATGHVEAAEAAAGWLRRLQAVNVGGCDGWAIGDLGAVAYDADAKAAAAAAGITDQTLGQWLRAGAQAVPALQWAPALGTERHLVVSPDYVRAGQVTRVGIIGADPGESLCVTRGNASFAGVANKVGEASIKVLLPGGTRTHVLTGQDEVGEVGSAEVKALGKLTVPFRIRNNVARGDQQVVRVSGLAPGELVRVRFRGDQVDAGQANDRGAWTGRFTAKRPLGEAKVTVFGQFRNRTASQTFTITK